MNKVKNYALIVLAVFVLITIWQLKAMTDRRNAERAAKERWQSNYLEAAKSMTLNKNIVLTQKEFIALRDTRISRLLDSLNIKPKIVVKYEEKVIVQRETTTVEVPVYKIGQGTYRINDSGPCFSWSGVATVLSEDSLKVARNSFKYDNLITDLYYRKQRGRFLFWKTYYKDKADMISVPKCGTSSTKTIDILK